MAAVMVLSRESGRLRKEILDPGGHRGEHLSLGPHQPDQESGRGVAVGHRLLDHGELLGPGLDPRGLSAAVLAAWAWPWAAGYHRELDILALGEEQSHHLGVAVSAVRLKLLLGASLLTAGAVSVSGVIGFVGLVVPHLVRVLAGPSHGRLLVLSAATGALILIWADVLARTLLASGQELPVGVVSALLGGPFFFYLLKSRRSRGMW